MKLKSFLILLITISFFVIPNLSTAQEVSYTPLQPIYLLDIGQSVPDLGSYLQKMFRGGIILVGILAVVMITFGGIQYMSTDAVFGKSEGINRITSALGGLILALSSWLILNTINSDLIKADVNINPTPNIDGGQLQNPDGASGTEGNSGQPGEEGESGSPDENESDGQAPTTGTDNSARNFNPEIEREVRQQLKNNGITINKRPCVDINDRDCTSVAGIQQNTLNGIIALKNQSGVSSLILSGGSEGGHSSGPNSHSNGYKIDVGYTRNPQFNEYMRNAFYGGADPAQYRSTTHYLADGQRIDIYPEDNHWDIKFH